MQSDPAASISTARLVGPGMNPSLMGPPNNQMLFRILQQDPAHPWVVHLTQTAPGFTEATVQNKIGMLAQLQVSLRRHPPQQQQEHQQEHQQEQQEGQLMMPQQQTRTGGATPPPQHQGYFEHMRAWPDDARQPNSPHTYTHTRMAAPPANSTLEELGESMAVDEMPSRLSLHESDVDDMGASGEGLQLDDDSTGEHLGLGSSDVAPTPPHPSSEDVLLPVPPLSNTTFATPPQTSAPPVTNTSHLEVDTGVLDNIGSVSHANSGPEALGPSSEGNPIVAEYTLGSPRPSLPSQAPVFNHISETEGSALGSLHVHCTLSLEEVVAEIAPVPAIGGLVESLTWIFQAIESVRVNKGQWRLLRGRCVMVARIARARVINHGQHDSPRLDDAANRLRDTFSEISARMRHYNEMEITTEFFQFEAISEEIERLFCALDSCLTFFTYTSDIARSQWNDELRVIQKQELADLDRFRQKLIEGNRNSKNGEVSPAQPAGRRTENLRSKGMSAQEMFECLKRHGCQDLTERVDMKTILRHAAAAGAYGDIFKGTLDNTTDVAIKVWSFRRAQEAPHKCLKGAMRELYNWSKADHKNIQKLLGVVMFEDRLGMVSKWMGNGNLHDYVQKHQPEDRYPLCMQAAKAVQHLHREQMVHGDLKACNFLVSSDGVIKLTDFDHSIISCHSIIFSQTTTMGGGTMRWMAPELVMDEGEVELRSTQADVYALGMTILEIITGAVPYLECQGDNQVFCKLSDKVLPERKEQFQGTKGDRTWELLVQCWDHDPALRPSADAVVESLRSLIPVTILPDDGA